MRGVSVSLNHLLSLFLILGLPQPSQPLPVASGLSASSPLASLSPLCLFSVAPRRRRREMNGALPRPSVSCVCEGVPQLPALAASTHRQADAEKGGRAQRREREERSSWCCGIQGPAWSAGDGERLWRERQTRRQLQRRREKRGFPLLPRPWRRSVSALAEQPGAETVRWPASSGDFTRRDGTAFLASVGTPCPRRPSVLGPLSTGRTCLRRAAFSSFPLRSLSISSRADASSSPQDAPPHRPSPSSVSALVPHSLCRSSLRLSSVRRGALHHCGCPEVFSSCSPSSPAPRRPPDPPFPSRPRPHLPSRSLSLLSSLSSFPSSFVPSLSSPSSSSSASRSVSSATFFAPSTTFSFFFFPSSPSFASSLVSSSSPFSSSRLNATHQDLPALAPPGGDPPADLSSSSPGFLSVEVDNFEPSPAYLPPRLPVPMHTFRPHPARQPGAAASLLPPIAPGVSPAPRLARAEARYQRLSPIKTRRVLAEIKGMSIGRALAHLATSPRRPAFQVFKTIQSALANAIHAFGAETLQPRIKSITANNGPVMKRPFFRARGKMDILRRPTTHIRVILEV
uniref:50S ribosomal protein L22, putative n=1 Tax=Neospora caninum (strain Liverpool) TaxID=572307 RepID=A0A0F7UIV3_NEOCL|nr:TPA: 50S ribosomal protein L22, putative [Neospora caninum Liverpool]